MCTCTHICLISGEEFLSVGVSVRLFPLHKSIAYVPTQKNQLSVYRGRIVGMAAFGGTNGEYFRVNRPVRLPDRRPPYLLAPKLYI
jgi:hypothetical protein